MVAAAAAPPPAAASASLPSAPRGVGGVAAAAAAAPPADMHSPAHSLPRHHFPTHNEKSVEATELTGPADCDMTGGGRAATAGTAGPPEAQANKRNRRRRKAADARANGGVSETKSADKTDAGREPASTTRGAVPQLARDATIVPPASSAPASALTGTGSGVRPGARPGQQATFAGGPGDRWADLGRG